jgi:pimeloyl-ACP methyl ester carboxylesterase
MTNPNYILTSRLTFKNELIKVILLLLSIFPISAFSQQSLDSLYFNFTKAYEKLDAGIIEKLYTQDAEMLNLYDGENSNSLKGNSVIKSYFERFFQKFKSENQSLNLTFKIKERKNLDSHILDNGFYRLEILTPNKPPVFTFGKFSTVLELEKGQWKFKTDATTNIDFLEFENALTSTIPIREELLYPAFYDELLGDYVNEKNELIVIGRSQARLYAFFENTNEYRGLNKENATTWSFGNTVISKENTQTIKFGPEKIEIYEKEKLLSIAKKQQFYKTEKVFFRNIKNVKLGGTLFFPQKPNGKAIVLVHGSGPQDRNGYASIIRLLADVFTREGITVLTYDKQGVGESEGNFESQNFGSLAQDALAGIEYLRSNKALGLTKIGLGGSSQAGWIIAKAIEQNKNVDFALTIGAAGSGITVEEQNLYNTEVLMKCLETLSKGQITKALTQQKYFFEFLSDQKNAKKLDEFTRVIEKDSQIRDWLFPISTLTDLKNRNQWFTALEIAFNPLSIWKEYKKPTLMVFSEFDDSTPTSKVISNIENLKNENIEISLIKNAQHIGLETNDICKNDIGNLHKFHSGFFTTMKNWLSNL